MMKMLPRKHFTKNMNSRGGGGIVVMYSSIFGLLQVNANTNKMMKSDIHRDIFTL